MAGYPAGHVPTADEIHDGDTWTDYSSSFAITAGTTNPTKGSGTVYSARWRLINAHEVVNAVNVSIGSGWAVGSGTPYFFTLSHTPADASGYGQQGTLFLANGTEYIGTVRIATSKAILYLPGQDGTTTNNHVIKAIQVGSGFGIASGATIQFSVRYEI